MRERTRPIDVKDTLADITKQMEDLADNPEEDLKDLPIKGYISSGCAIVNCALSDRHDWGWPRGRISHLTADSDLGKSAFGTTMLAEAAQAPDLDPYRLLDLDIENARSRSMFGRKYDERVEHWYTGCKDYPVPATVEELHMLINQLFKDKDPFAMLVDSVDFLPSKQALEETEQAYKIWCGESKEKESGSYNMAKQKYLKKMLGEVAGKIGQTESMILLVGQIISNIKEGGGKANYGPKTTFTGGYGVKFSPRIRAELVPTGEVDKVRNRIVGREVAFKVKKNHVTFKRRDVNFWIYEGMGIDDIRSTVEFLIKEKHWSKDGAKVTAPEFPPVELDGKGNPKPFTMRELVQYIDKSNSKQKLNLILQRVWNEIEKDIAEFVFANRTSPYL